MRASDNKSIAQKLIAANIMRNLTDPLPYNGSMIHILMMHISKMLKIYIKNKDRRSRIF